MDTKRCCRCKEIKPISGFNKDRSKKDGYRDDCRICSHKIQEIRYKRISQFIGECKLSKGCSVCGYNKCAEALDFHHINNDKEFGISASTLAIEKLKEEMKKCIVLCSNCHKELHVKMKLGGQVPQ